ncbi:hypothetical protein MMC07_001419 [Pseudocyphellaria aurata]|nr:hypothetical protein [Pseudocyphellaria aurata]
MGVPALHHRQNGVTCQTSSASPLTGDVTDVINQVRGQGGSCPNTNGAASDCTTLVKHKGAAISVCGEVDDGGSALSCEDVANFANQIQQACLNGPGDDPNTRTGGTYTVSPSKRVEVIAN